MKSQASCIWTLHFKGLQEMEFNNIKTLQYVHHKISFDLYQTTQGAKARQNETKRPETDPNWPKTAQNEPKQAKTRNTDTQQPKITQSYIKSPKMGPKLTQNNLK